MAKKEPWNKTRHGTLPHGTIVKVQLFGVITGYDDEYYEASLFGQNGEQLTEVPIAHLKPEDILTCRKPPELDYA